MVDSPSHPPTASESKLSEDVFYDSSACDRRYLQQVFSELQNPHFISSFYFTYQAPVKKIGNSCGFVLHKKVASFLNLDPGDDVALILMPNDPTNTTNRESPSKEEIDALYNKYDYYFRFKRGTTLSDFNFQEIGSKYHVPIYTRVTQSGTSYALTIAPEVLNLFGFELNQEVNLLIRKEQNEQ